MPIGVADFVKSHDAFKYLMFVALLFGLAFQIDFFGVSFKLGDIFFIPISFAFATFGVFISFELFYILVWVIFILIFTLRMNFMSVNPSG